MTNQEQLVVEFQETLERNKQIIEQRREQIRRETGRSMPKNRSKWLKDFALKQARERLAS